ncbi:MAG: ACT domain-containing protein [Verrucomicrobiota bacterium]
MISTLIMTILGPDRPGLVNSLADAVARHGGNWSESRMVRLGGQFAGVVKIEIPQSAAEALLTDLREPGIPGLVIQTARQADQDDKPRRTVRIDIIGNDRPGIVRELTGVIVSAGGNVEELVTSLESAPMSGQPMFRAKGIVSVAEERDAEQVVAAIERLSGEFTVDVGN